MKVDVDPNTYHLKIHIGALMDNLTSEAKEMVIEQLACEQEIVKRVTQQIIDKWTESGSHGPVSCAASESPTTGLDWAWREVARRAGDVAAREIKRLEDALAYETKSHQQTLELLQRKRETYC